MPKENYNVTISFPADIVEKLNLLQKSYVDQGIDLSFNKLVVAVIRQASNAGLLAPVVSIGPAYDPAREELYGSATAEIVKLATDGKDPIVKLRRAKELWVAIIGDRDATREGDHSKLGKEHVLSAVKAHLDSANTLRRQHNRPILTPVEFIDALINRLRVEDA
jgi:hypothetical protein